MSKYTPLLTAVTRAARECGFANKRLDLQVRLCCKNNVPRYLVFMSICNAGWTKARARVVVSTVYCEEGKRIRKPGAGRKTDGWAKRIACFSVKLCGGRKRAVPALLAAYRHLNSVTK